MLQGADEDSIESEDDQQNICDAFVDFVKVHQALLMTLIGKNSIIAQTPFTAPVAAVLRLIEGGVDELAFALIGFVPSCADEAEMEKKKLDGSISDAIDAFSG